MGNCASAPPEVSKNYVRIRLLDTGSGSEVYLEEDVRTKQQVAVKYIPRQDVDYHVVNEVLNFSLCQHPRIISFREAFWTPDSLAISMEHAEGGNLLDYINQKGALSERDARNFFQQIIAGVDHCHFNDIVLRDIKPENILLVGTTDGKQQLKLCDFGVSTTDEYGQLLKTAIGTQLYASPENLGDPTVVDGKKADVWSTGVLLYIMLYGAHPFATGEELRKMRMQPVYQRIIKCELQLPAAPAVSEGAKALLRQIVFKDPKERLSIAQIIRNPWFKEGLPGSFWDELQNSRRAAESKDKTRQKWKAVMKQGNPKLVA